MFLFKKDLSPVAINSHYRCHYCQLEDIVFILCNFGFAVNPVHFWCARLALCVTDVVNLVAVSV